MPLDVGGDDRQHGELLLQCEVLEALDDDRDPLLLEPESSGHRHLLQVVDDDERGLAGAPGHVCGYLGDLCQVGGRPAGAVDEEPLGVAVHRVEGRCPARVEGQPLGDPTVAGARALHRRPDLPEREAVDSVGGTGLLGDQPLQHRRGIVLERVVDAGPSTGDHGAQLLQGERGLAQTLRPTEEGELAGPEPPER
jgi:hypothetical protein